MEMNRANLLKEIQRYDFVANELVLFLDTHPTDKKALEMHESVVNKSNELKKQFEQTYGPLTSDGVMSKDKWTWIESPWPLENQ